MIALGELSPIDTARAKLQEQIAGFLASRARLIRLMDNQSLSIKGQAQGLYAVQSALEDRLQNEITPKLQAINSGVWDASDVLTIGGFTFNIIRQINDVNSLEKQAGGSVYASNSGFDMTTILLGAGVILGLGIMSGVFFGRRPTI